LHPLGRERDLLSGEAVDHGLGVRAIAVERLGALEHGWTEELLVKRESGIPAERERPAVGGPGLGDAALIFADLADVLVRDEKGGIELDRLLVERERLIEPLLDLQDSRPVVVRLGGLGRGLGRPLEAGLGVVEPAVLVEDEAEEVQELGVLPRRAERRLVLPDRTAEVALRLKKQREVSADEDDTRVDRERAPVTSLGVVEPAEARVEGAEVAERAQVLRVARKRLLVALDRPADVAASQEMVRCLGSASAATLGRGCRRFAGGRPPAPSQLNA
jgi:hypothetical protein